jgi:pyruvate,water dikinase
MAEQIKYVVWFDDESSSDIRQLGGKNASLGEMTRKMRAAGVEVPDGFGITASSYWAFVNANGLREPISAELERIHNGTVSLPIGARRIRDMFLRASFPTAMADAITSAYRALCERAGVQDLDVAVRSSATAEDLPDASFAGQHESYLNIRGEKELLNATRRCFSSLFTDRAIVYRQNHGFDHMRVALSVGVQRMVHSERASSGVMFSIDTETGFPRTVLINASWGLGEAIVQGLVEPDEYVVFKPLLDNAALSPIIEKTLGAKARKIVYSKAGRRPTRILSTPLEDRRRYTLDDSEILRLARWAVAIESHYQRPMDMEWAKDADSGKLFIVQARPETVQSRREAGALKNYRIKSKGERLLTGLAIGDGIVAGRVCKLKSATEIGKFTPGSILVTSTTDPDWVPIMKRAAAIITDHGGRTSHAAIVSRELGLPAIVGTGHATAVLEDGREVTVSCAEGDTGYVYAGLAEFEASALAIEALPKTRTKVMLNMANPAASARWWRLPADGIGLARMEFIVGNQIKIHPMALVKFDLIKNVATRRRIERMTAGFTDKTRYFVDNLAYGIARIAATRYPDPVIVRMSDFKTNEYAELIGGSQFEPKEENPMLGWRGASRYYSEGYRDGFALECRALRKVRDEIGLRNVIVMIPFCRTVEEADRTLAVMADNGLRRGDGGLEVYVMCEIPANVILADEFARRFDGFSIGSNDLTQLTLGVDRDSELLAPLFDEQNRAVKQLISSVIKAAHKQGRKVGLCGQAPSDHPEFARFLVEEGIDSISVSPDSFIAVKQQVASAEGESMLTAAGA